MLKNEKKHIDHDYLRDNKWWPEAIITVIEVKVIHVLYEPCPWRRTPRMINRGHSGPPVTSGSGTEQTRRHQSVSESKIKNR